jgi:uncharacterized protein YeaO (DUF488 family)
LTTCTGLSIARVYDPMQKGSGVRFLVDRVWPRGALKDDLRLDDWIKEAAPSTALRRWFGHDPNRWAGFQGRYRAELDAKPDAVTRCLGWCRKGPVVLLYSAKDRNHNQAVVLHDYLAEVLARESGA